MKMSLRVRLLGTIIGAIVLFFIISVVAARLVLSKDLRAQGETEVTNGAGAFGGYWDSRKDQIKLLVAQDAVQDALRKNLQAGNSAALQDQLSNIARTSGLSFLTVVDANGNVVARANGPQKGSLKGNSLISRALTGETVSTATLLDTTFLNGEGLAPQAQSDIKGAGGTVVAHINKGLSIVSAAPISDANERTIGAIYGGVLMNHYYDLVDQAKHALGGSSAVLEGDAIVASTIEGTDGTRVVDVQVGPAASVVQTGTAFTGSDTQGGTEYLVHVDPIQDDQNVVVGARWYGVPMAQINDIINHITLTLLLWGFIAMILALALGDSDRAACFEHARSAQPSSARSGEGTGRHHRRQRGFGRSRRADQGGCRQDRHAGESDRGRRFREDRRTQSRERRASERHDCARHAFGRNGDAYEAGRRSSRRTQRRCRRPERTGYG